MNCLHVHYGNLLYFAGFEAYDELLQAFVKLAGGKIEPLDVGKMRWQCISLDWFNNHRNDITPLALQRRLQCPLRFY